MRYSIWFLIEVVFHGAIMVNTRVKSNASGARNSIEKTRRRCNEKIHAFVLRGKKIDKPLL